ncbi:MAG: hypothetical protein KF823_07975 [Xanthomonadales bacterium]|nr:hypothetical protein [Xanthomonadales bacterium]
MGRSWTAPLLSTLMALAIPAGASAQTGGIPAPALTTEPSPPPAGLPFQATFWRWSSVPTGGFGGNAPTIVIDGTVVRIHFDPGCGFLCPPASVYRAWPFTMPALPAGTHTVIFGTSSADVAQFQLTVGGGVPATPVPAVASWSLALLVLLTVAIAALRRPRQRHSLNRVRR